MMSDFNAINNMLRAINTKLKGRNEDAARTTGKIDRPESIGQAWRVMTQMQSRISELEAVLESTQTGLKLSLKKEIMWQDLHTEVEEEIDILKAKLAARGDSLPVITEEVFNDYWGERFIEYDESSKPQWTQDAVDFACLCSSPLPEPPEG